eukprot:TRINITY_DN40759_c0_g2_i1.p1 TRINITY_DN40759_c0_g2~~TRINITY_DN40759_c0_g2_i1.p1  ORF type:complete len:101 (-),score=1.16 TRINITY_DN40759_c0_g2_i1:77-379(-)
MTAAWLLSNYTACECASATRGFPGHRTLQCVRYHFKTKNTRHVASSMVCRCFRRTVASNENLTIPCSSFPSLQEYKTAFAESRRRCCRMPFSKNSSFAGL